MGVFSVVGTRATSLVLAVLFGLFLTQAAAHDNLETPELFRGDANDDGSVDLSDGVHLLEYLFLGGSEPRCAEIADVNIDGVVDLGDPVGLFFALFLGGEALAPLSHAEVDSCLGRGPELSFASIQEKIFQKSCSSASCHDSEGAKAGLILETAELSYDSLVFVVPFNEAAEEVGLFRVDPGQPENSFLLRKLEGPDIGEGNRMPLGLAPLSEDKIAAIREWIAFGAPFEGAIPGVPDIEDTPAPPPARLEPPPVPENGLQIHLEPFQIAAGREREIFKLYDPGFTEDVVVERIDIHMTENSHHFIFYTWNNLNDLPPPGLREIGSVTGIGAGSRSFITGAQTSFFSLELPEGTGMPFAKGTLFDLNSHYLNLDGEETLLGEVYINLFFAPSDQPIIRAESVLFGNFALFIPPGETRTSGAYWPPSGVTRETHIHALSSHMHRHGEYFKTTWKKKDGSEEVVYESPDWDDPLYKPFSPPLVMNPGDRFFFECTHTNDDRDVPLLFGLESEDEMCFILVLLTEP